jgi:hypothetical protein
MYLNAELLMDMFGQMLGAIDGTVLTAGAAEAEHEGGEAALQVAGYVGIGELVDAVEEGDDFAVVLEESDDGLVESCQFLVGLVAPGVVGAATVEHISAAITTLILRNAFLIAETEHLDNQRALGIVL